MIPLAEISLAVIMIPPYLVTASDIKEKRLMSLIYEKIISHSD